jgi:S-adenosylmethionine hydrolase
LDAYRFTTIGFLSDFGLVDEFVGVCHGVIARIAPKARVIDITHGIGAHQVASGALALVSAVGYLPTAVHLAVVDPGVGSDRLGIVVQTREGSCLVGPDNGLLLPAAERLGGVAGCHRLENPALRAARVSPTFHGRDIFAPAAAHLALGVAPEDFGAPVRLDDLVAPAIPQAVATGGACRGVVVAVDRFGNLETTITPDLAASAGVRVGSLLALTVGDRALEAPFARTFSAVAAGEPVVIEDSRNLLAVCLNQASAAERLGVREGTPVVLAPVSAPLP